MDYFKFKSEIQEWMENESITEVERWLKKAKLIKLMSSKTFIHSFCIMLAIVVGLCVFFFTGYSLGIVIMLLINFFYAQYTISNIITDEFRKETEIMFETLKEILISKQQACTVK